MGSYIPYSYDTKRQCVEMYMSGIDTDQIYLRFCEMEPERHLSKRIFTGELRRWAKNPNFADTQTLINGTYDGFIAKNATVQVNGSGQITQAWIKQTRDEEMLEEVLTAIGNIPKVPKLNKIKKSADKSMLEIPLFDMHFGINTYTDYIPVLERVISILSQRKREKVIFIIGQDLFHNDDFRGRTTKGTQVDKVDIVQAWQDATLFYYTLFDIAIKWADKVEARFSEGNHDETLGWAFFKSLMAAYNDQIEFDDDRMPRKCITWNKVFIGYGHCDDGRTDSKNIRLQFTIEFPKQFANASAREIHLGHLHTEFKDGDVSGVVVRRLSSANKTDQWHTKNGYVGNHKRFQLFEYSPNSLDAIYYV